MKTYVRHIKQGMQYDSTELKMKPAGRQSRHRKKVSRDYKYSFKPERTLQNTYMQFKVELILLKKIHVK